MPAEYAHRWPVCPLVESEGSAVMCDARPGPRSTTLRRRDSLLTASKPGGRGQLSVSERALRSVWENEAGCARCSHQVWHSILQLQRSQRMIGWGLLEGMLNSLRVGRYPNEATTYYGHHQNHLSNGSPFHFANHRSLDCYNTSGLTNVS